MWLNSKLHDKYGERLNGGGNLLVTSAIWGVIPLSSALADGGEAPFVFLTAWSLGATTAVLAYLLLYHRQLLRWAEFRHFVPRRGAFFKNLEDGHSPSWNWQVVLAQFSAMGLAFYAWSTAFMPEAIAAILVESWPIFFIFLMQVLFKGERIFQLTPAVAALFLFIFLGVILVVRAGSSDSDAESAFSGWDMVVGILLLVVSISFIVQTASHIKWTEVAYKWQQTRVGGGSGMAVGGGVVAVAAAAAVGATADASPIDARRGERTKLGFFMLARLVSAAIGVVMGLIWQNFSDGSLSFKEQAIGFGTGAFVISLGNITTAVGTLRSKSNSELQAIRYTTPVFGIFFLWLFSYVTDVRTDFLVFGLLAIVVGNALITFQNRDKFGFTLLVMALWVFALSLVVLLG